MPDPLADERLRTRPLARAGIRFYAGAPLVTRAGFGLGTICVVDDHPRTIGAELASEERDRRLVKTVIDAAHDLRFRVVAEGVETEEAHALLRSFGCDEAQGHLLGRPMPVPEFERWLAAWHGDALARAA